MVLDLRDFHLSWQACYYVIWPTAEQSCAWCASCSTGRILSTQKMFKFPLDVMATNRATVRCKKKLTCRDCNNAVAV